MILVGGILTVLGIVSIIYGVNQNNSWSAQLLSVLSSRSTNPGTIWIVLGVIAIVVGLIIIYFDWKKKNP